MTQYVLEILDGDRAGDTVPLSKERLTIGRKPSNGLPINDEKISGQHAEIVFEDGSFMLRDLGSTNGTLLDGRKVEEVVLTSFDTFQVGRVRFLFKEEGAESPQTGLTVHRIDKDALARSGSRRGALGLVVAILLVGGAGAWYYLQPEKRERRRGGPAKSTAVAPVAGNKIPGAASSCEDAEKWKLAAAGSTFDLGGPAHTGQTALSAVRAAQDEGASIPPGYALARLAEPILVVSGEKLKLSGHVRTSGGGLGAVRLRFSSEVGDALYTGTTPAAADSYTEVALEAAAPPGMDRVEVEVLAILPTDDAEVLVDDVALVAGGAGEALDLRAAACNLIGARGSFSIRAAETPVLLGAAPLVSGPLAELGAAGLLAFSDAGVEATVTKAGGGFSVAVGAGAASSPGIALHFPVGVGADVRTRGTEPTFAPYSGGTEASGVREILVGAGAARMLIRLPAPTAVSAARARDRVVLTFRGTTKLDLVVDFETQRIAARTALRQAESMAKTQPGKALDTLRRLIEEVPHDDRVTSQALRLRTETLLGLRQQVDRLEVELATAEFFGASSALRRLDGLLTRLVRTYGTHNLPEPDRVTAMQQRITERITEIRNERIVSEKADLEALVEGFEAMREEELHALVKGYLERHFGGGE